MQRYFVIKIFVILALLTGFGFYGFYIAKNYREGPRIEIDQPTDGQVFDNAEIFISGRAKNIASLFLNGRQIFVDKEGKFEEKLLIAKGYNIMEVLAKDKFNRDIKVIREIILK